RTRRRAGGVPELPDRRLMEGELRHLVQSLQGGADPDSPPAKAQALLDRAFAQRNADRRVPPAREALALWPDCADAYVVLAEHARTRKEAAALLEQGIAAGERALGPETFQRDAGHFWGLLETRPYMRARMELAMALWTLGRRDEAVQHLQELLRLNPGDN